MSPTGAQPPRRAGLARLTGTATRVRTAVREHRSWSRERRDALAYFHDELGLSAGANVQDVLDIIGEQRGRRLRTHVLSSLPPTVSGVALLGTTDEDIIGISDRLSPWQQAHVKLHEARHFGPSGFARTGSANDHSTTVHTHFAGVSLQSLEAHIAALPPRLREEILSRPMRLRETFTEDEERMCEVFAHAVMPLLALDATDKRTGPLTTAFSNRRSI
ncbi:hypothetical protein AB0F77_31970 [Streptomyces sp. NPDC026672]|uniref:hypothetical protein n=1 Tax=unclassified Streptomyces TaxID=2593676 RepID=UPI0033D44E88